MLKFMETPPLCPQLVACPHCHATGRIGVHSHTERRHECHACGVTFAKTKGTPPYDLKYPHWGVVLVLTLLAHGCPVPAVVAAFGITERTIADCLTKAGSHAEHIQATVVCNGQVSLTQVDELRVKTQRGAVWMATAMCVFSRLFLWGEVARARNQRLINRLIGKVRAAASAIPQAVVFVSNDFAAYPKAILKHFYTLLRTGQRGRPAHQPWPDLHIVQVVKSRVGEKVKEIQRRLVHGC
jgi:transposase-like protein